MMSHLPLLFQPKKNPLNSPHNHHPHSSLCLSRRFLRRESEHSIKILLLSSVASLWKMKDERRCEKIISFVVFFFSFSLFSLRMEIENEEILRWWDCSILWGVTSGSLTQLQRGVMSKNEGEIISSIVSTLLKKIFSVCAFVGLAAKCVCVDICISFGSVWVFRCGSQVCKCVGSSGEKKKDLYTGLKSLIKGWQIFPRLLCSSEATAGLLFSWPPPFLLPPSLILDYWRGCGGGALFFNGLCVDVLHSCGTRRTCFLIEVSAFE